MILQLRLLSLEKETGKAAVISLVVIMFGFAEQRLIGEVVVPYNRIISEYIIIHFSDIIFTRINSIFENFALDTQDLVHSFYTRWVNYLAKGVILIVYINILAANSIINRPNNLMRTFAIKFKLIDFSSFIINIWIDLLSQLQNFLDLLSIFVKFL